MITNFVTRKTLSNEVNIQGLILCEERQREAQRNVHITIDGEVKQFSCRMDVPPHLYSNGTDIIGWFKQKYHE